MEISTFTFRLVLIFLPGLFSLIIIESLTHHPEIKLHKYLIFSMLLGFVCYLSLYAIVEVFCLHIEVVFLRNITDNVSQISVEEVLYTTLLALPFGFLIAWIINRKFLHRFANILRVSNKFGDVDVWGFIMNSTIPEWVVVRDFEHDLMIKGWIQAFSDSKQPDELFIRDVQVFKNSTAELMYEAPAVYISRRRENFHLEFPVLYSRD